MNKIHRLEMQIAREREMTCQKSKSLICFEKFCWESHFCCFLTPLSVWVLLKFLTAAKQHRARFDYSHFIESFKFDCFISQHQHQGQHQHQPRHQYQHQHSCLSSPWFFAIIMYIFQIRFLYFLVGLILHHEHFIMIVITPVLLSLDFRLINDS